MEVVKIEIKLVGGVSDIKDISEIENIAKVFVIEQRISNLNPIKNTKKKTGPFFLSRCHCERSAAISPLCHYERSVVISCYRIVIAMSVAKKQSHKNDIFIIFL